MCTQRLSGCWFARRVIALDTTVTRSYIIDMATKNSTKHGKSMMLGDRRVSIVRFDSFHVRKVGGSPEAQYEVVGITDGCVGMAFASELVAL